ncbi:MAG: hypothetical protein KME45_16870 [Stenomitos rutilans HA7619-LM2]|jgi:hypothetical protein|nr:hypothetical protein [Stenomitos rutilans HA7619-LM2]
MDGWASLRLGIRFVPSKNPLHIIRPDGKPFLTFVELGNGWSQNNSESKTIANEPKTIANEQRHWRIFCSATAIALVNYRNRYSS